MKAKCLDDWIEEFEVRTRRYFNTEPKEVIVWREDKGFCGYVILVERQELFVTKCVGDGQFWFRKLLATLALLKEHGITHMCSRTIIKPKVYERLFKPAKLISVEQRLNCPDIYLMGLWA